MRMKSRITLLLLALLDGHATRLGISLIPTILQPNYLELVEFLDTGNQVGPKMFYDSVKSTSSSLNHGGRNGTKIEIQNDLM